MKVYLLIVKSTDSKKLIAAHVFSTAKVAGEHGDEIRHLLGNDATVEISPQIVQEE
ncbi:hypothetical protein LCGC14_1442580 [marine sediment metagenome]|uniref:Uncharacterized protein n=1 Tax=marine sediment metagenome TaxID=412755 RepID=A0A0F9JKA9_9ZZZZ